MRDVLLKAYSLTVMFSVPLTVGIGLTAESFVPLVFGVNWLDTIPVIQILVFSALANSVQAPVRPILLAIKRPELVTSLSVINALILIPALIIGTWVADLEGAAWALVIENTAMVIVQHHMLRRFLQATLTQVLSRLWRTLVSCCLMAWAVWEIQGMLIPPPTAGIAEQLFRLALVVTVGALIYGAGLLCLWCLSGRPADSAEGIIVTLVRNRLRRTPRQAKDAITSGGKTGT
jgi:O-antigen/teichoic acid export membrane protein